MRLTKEQLFKIRVCLSAAHEYGSISDRAGEETVGWIKACESAQDEIERQLALLENPVVGMRVEVEGLKPYVYAGGGVPIWSQEESDGYGHLAMDSFLRPLLRKAVEGGAKVEIPGATG